MNVKITDNTSKVKEQLQDAVVRALEKIGLAAEGYAKRLCPVDTGNLRNSITHQVDEAKQAAYIGTNNEYAAYVELGTGKYYSGGRPDPWVYQDEKGNVLVALAGVTSFSNIPFCNIFFMAIALSAMPR